MKAAYLLAAGMFLAAVSCERHDWEETRILHETHGGHQEGHAHGEGEAHGEGDGHGDHGDAGH